MSELACNVVLYHPNPEALASKYSYWHLEALLTQADLLITRCLRDFREYCALDYQWHQLESDLQAQEKKLGLFRQPAEPEPALAPVHEGDGGHSSELSMEQPELPASEAPAEAEAEPETWVEPGIKGSIDLRVEAFQRKMELSSPGRPFALYQQRDQALKLLCRDYEEAVDRACVAEEGFRKLYDRAELSSPRPGQAETLGESITSLAIWIRDSLEWLERYHQKEQEFVRVVSLRSLLNRTAWQLLKHARDSYTLKLQIPADLFRGHDNCLIKGVGAALVGEAGTVPWTMVLRVPEEAVLERSGQSVEVSQGDRQPCLLGRVENRRSVRPLQFGGQTVLLNASPVGRPTQGGLWSIDLVRPAGATSESFAHVEDVVLEIRVVGAPQKSAGQT